MENLMEKAHSALRSSERALNLDIPYILRGGLWTTLSFGIGTLASLVTMVAFGNLLPREAYGTYNYLLSLGASLSFLTLSGMGVGVLRAVARGHENVVPHALRLQLKWNLIATATVMTAAAYYGYKGNMLFAAGLFMLAFAYPIAEAFHINLQVLNAKKRFDLITRFGSITTLVGTALTVTTLFLTDNVLILIGVYFLMALAPNIIIYNIVAQGLDKSAPDPEQIKEMKRTAFHITASGLIGMIASYIDKIILFQAAGPAALAVYGFALAGPDRLKSLIKNWASIAQPRLAQSSLESIRLVLYKRIAFSMLVGGGLSLIYWFMAPLLFKLFLPLYLDAIPYSQTLALSLIVSSAAVYLSNVFSTQNMLRATYLFSLGNHIVRILLYVGFAWFWQIWGLIVASILSNAFNAIYGLIIWEIEYRRLKVKNE